MTKKSLKEEHATFASPTMSAPLPIFKSMWLGHSAQERVVSNPAEEGGQAVVREGQVGQGDQQGQRVLRGWSWLAS